MELLDKPLSPLNSYDFSSYHEPELLWPVFNDIDEPSAWFFDSVPGDFPADGSLYG
jgi:hypothetical protein